MKEVIKEYSDFISIENKINNVKNLKELFLLWSQAHRFDDEWKITTEKGILKDSFVEDGYICKSRKDFNGILFILLEANIANYFNNKIDKYEDNQFEFYRKYIDNEENDNIPKMKEKMGRMAYYVVNGKVFETSDFKRELNKSAFMNLNKRGGGKHPNKEILFNYCYKYKKFIKKQIQLINPSCIICIGSYKYLFDIGLIDNDKYLEVWHTAYGMTKRKRNHIYNLKDSNVDLYMEEFVERYNKKFKK